MSDPRLAPPERITITYAASQALLAAPLTPHFINLLREQLPLRNLHWRPSQSTLDAVAARAAQQGKPAYAPSSVVPGSTIRTIQTLDVALKPLTDEIRRWRGDPGYFEQPGAAGLLDRPFVHLYLVVCEDSEHYRTTVRNEIRSWISSLSFFHAKQATPPSHPPSVGTSVLSSSSRSSLALGSFRSATPPVRSETPPTTSTGTSSGPHTPTNQGAPSKPTTHPLVPAGPTEPEYLIVLITPPEGAGITGFSSTSSAEAKTGMGRFMNKSKNNVLEKARADFNTSKKEHVVQLSRLPPVPAVPHGRSGLHSMDPTIWAELLTKMREAASSTFTTTIEAQEEEISRCGVARGQSGWDFCSYFLAKDALARTLEAVGLKDDAVGQYEDLEIVFAQAMQSGAVSFAPIGGDDPNDDSLPLLDVAKKPYADLIRRREISLFDFRCYLFARKSALLGKMGRVAAVMREAPLFIGAVGRMLRRNRRLSSQWIQSWIFSAALDVVEQCQAWLIQRGGQSAGLADDSLSPAFHSNKSELLDVARRQLDRIGIEAGHLPSSEPFAFAAADECIGVSHAAVERDLPPLPDTAQNGEGGSLGAAIELDPKRGTSRPELQRAVESREHFDSYYLTMCDRILAGWKVSVRNRDALHVRTIVATLHYLRGRYQVAYDSLVELTEAYAAAKFAALEGHTLAMQLECHAKLTKANDRAWIIAALAALRHNVQTPTQRRNVEAEAAKWTDPSYLCDQLRKASTALEKEIPVSGFPLFTIAIREASARLAETEDGSLLAVDVTSLLPCAQAVEDVRVCLVGAGGATLWFTSSKSELRPGTTNVELFCPHPAHGVYTVDVTQIRIARLIFQYDHGSATSSKEPAVVRVPKDGAAPSVSVGLPRQIDLDQPRAIEVTIRSGRDEMDVDELSVTSTDGAPLVDYAGAKTASDADVKLATLDADQGSAVAVKITSLQKDSKVAVLLPLTQLPESGLLDAVVTLTYTSSSSPVDGQQRRAIGKKRTLKVPVQLKTALPLGVNVQDFFRSSCLLSKFTISAGGGGSIRLRPVTLGLDGGAESVPYDIQTCGSQREAIITPRQPATYLFRISKRGSGSAADSEGKGLRLAVHYRPLLEDAIAFAIRALDRLAGERGLEHLQEGRPARRLVQDALVSYVRERLDLPAFSITGQVRTGPLDSRWWKVERRSWGQSPLTLDALLELVEVTLNSILPGVHGEEEEKEEMWQRLTIPVDVPSVDFVNAVTLSIGSAKAVERTKSYVEEQASLIVGQPVQLTVDIRTCSQWAASSPADESSTVEMVYDVVPDFDTWLVDGSKRGTFRVGPLAAVPLQTDGATFSVTLTVVPLRTGSLALPTVLVRPLAHPELAGARLPTCETHTTNAAQRVQVVAAKTTKAFFVPTSGQHHAELRLSATTTARDSWKSDKMLEKVHAQY